MRILFLTIFSLPVLALGTLALYALALLPLRYIPKHEYDQAVRAPLWLVVLVCGSMPALALLALGQAPADGTPALAGWPHGPALLRADGFSLWGAAVLGAAAAAAAWVPAARRTLGARALAPAALLLLALQAALLLLFGRWLGQLLAAWLGLLLAAGLLWAWLARPRRRWEDWEPLAALALSALCAVIGLLWLQGLARNAPLSDAWSTIIIAPPRAVNGAIFFCLLGWLLPAVYLPWWLAGRRDDAVQAWAPAAMLAALAGPLALLRVYWAFFPTLHGNLPEDVAFVTRNLLIWLQAWGVLALVIGAGWLVYHAWRWKGQALAALRPLPLAAAGLLLIGLAPCLQTQSAAGVAACVWLYLAWAGSTTLLLTAGVMLDALTPSRTAERRILAAGAWSGLGWLLIASVLGLVAGWGSFAAIGAPRPLILLALLVTAAATAWLLPRWLRDRYATIPYPGAGWGILAPFSLTLLLLALLLLAARLAPHLTLIHRGLMPTN